MTEVAAKSRAGRANKGAKPGERRGGRQKGTPNKLTGDVRAMVLGALDGAGGMDYLIRQARENPGAFLTLVGKCLPKEVVGEGGGPIQVATVFRLADLK